MVLKRSKLFAALVAAALFSLLQVSPVWAIKVADVDVYFSPQGGCTEAIVRQIDQAREEVLVQAYSFSSAPIAQALLKAHKRGVRVEIILDKSQRSQRYSSSTFFAHAGIPTYIDGRHAIAHDKVMIIDRAVVITGSFNFTKAAQEKNAENLLIGHSRELAEKYRGHWYDHRSHAEEYGGHFSVNEAPAKGGL
ncbi:MAG: phospholipase D family protein [Smithellaceae bacterium]|nr:phospholipase D family protein [Smithellaceae bacterium]